MRDINKICEVSSFLIKKTHNSAVACVFFLLDQILCFTCGFKPYCNLFSAASDKFLVLESNLNWCVRSTLKLRLISDEAKKKKIERQ